MDLLNGRIRPLYFKSLSAAFGSALISCIYGMVDMAMVGQYQGPDGTAGDGGTVGGDIENAVDDAGNAVGGAMDDVGDAAKNAGKAVSDAVKPK